MASMQRAYVYLLAAISEDGYMAVSLDDRLAWVPKDDKLWFKEFTQQKRYVIIGRKTFDLLPKTAHRGRVYLVYSKAKHKDLELSRLTSMVEGVYYVNYKPAVLLKMLHNIGVNEVVLAGGSKIYDMFLDQGLVDEIYLTIVKKKLTKGILFPLQHLSGFVKEQVKEDRDYARYRYVKTVSKTS